MSEAVETRRVGAFYFVPVVAFLVIAAVFWVGLGGNPAEVPSALIGKPVPEFDLPPVEGLDVPGLAARDLKRGRVTVINIWGSWCGPCRSEHPLLMELSKRGDIALFGIDYKDDAENARRFLGTLGNPFQRIGADPKGRAFIDWGAYGVPETFVVDGEGIVRFKWIGELTPKAVETKLLPEIAKAAKLQTDVRPTGRP